MLRKQRMSSTDTGFKQENGWGRRKVLYAANARVPLFFLALAAQTVKQGLIATATGVRLISWQVGRHCRASHQRRPLWQGWGSAGKRLRWHTRQQNIYKTKLRSRLANGCCPESFQVSPIPAVFGVSLGPLHGSAAKMFPAATLGSRQDPASGVSPGSSSWWVFTPHHLLNSKHHLHRLPLWVIPTVLSSPERTTGAPLPRRTWGVLWFTKHHSRLCLFLTWECHTQHLKDAEAWTRH